MAKIALKRREATEVTYTVGVQTETGERTTEAFWAAEGAIPGVTPVKSRCTLIGANGYYEFELTYRVGEN